MIEIVLSIGVINGLILGILLLTIKNGNPVATKVFGLVVLLISLMILENLLIIMGLHQTFPHFLRSTDGLFLLMLPALYLYGLLATETKSNIGKKDILHLLPFVLFTFLLMPFYLLSGEEKLAYDNQNEIAVLGYVKAVSAFVYFPLTALHVIRFRKRLSVGHLPTNNLQNVQWFYRMMILLIVIGTVSFVIFTFENIGIHFSGLDSDTVTSMLLTLTFYVNGFVLIRNPYILWGPSQFSKAPERIDGEKSKYRNSPLTHAQMKEFLALLTDQMESHQVFKNSELSPKDLEELTGIKSHYITEVLNTLLGRNFYEFVNAYRVEEVKALISDSENNNKTLLALGLESGFNSKASFNRIFKLHVGKSPSQFKKEAHKN